MHSSKKVQIFLLPIAVFLFLIHPAGAVQVDQSQQPGKIFKYNNLFKSLNSANRSTNFIAFTDFATDQDKDDRNASLDYLSSRPQLIDRIRNDLGSKEIHWQLSDLSSRLIYVPESRKEVAGLFTEYCRETISDVLDRTGLANPYSSISTLTDDAADPTEGKGIRAIIVQNLAREYVARFQFSGNTEKRIEIGLSGRTTVNEVGSYSSYIEYSEENDDWQFLSNQQTVWKSVSANPYTVLMTPLEETLHIALRKHTEKAILAALHAKPKTPTLKEVHAVIEDWLAVEEAVVGGLVYSLVPDVVIKRIPDLPREWIKTDLETKAQFHKYRLLPRAIKMVQDYGLKESIDFYEQDPAAARSLLEQHG